ncbi:MAG: zinc ribbon domain-containing protein [Candidatus Lokiarchaeota archaeon]|nr:zinc ribbon domain-containing protein [Candidatus Lokiarchaeota archaeon]
MSNICSKCGFELREDWNLCPECGEIFEEKRDELKSIRAKTKPGNQKLAEKIWILTFIAGIIGILSLLTPASTVSVSLLGEVLLSMDSWMFGLNIFYEYGVGYDIFFTRNEFFLGVGIFSLIVLVIVNLVVIGSGIGSRKDIYKSKTDYFDLYLAAGQVIGALIYIIGMAIVYWFLTGEAYWGFLGLGLALIGQFVAALLLVISFGIRYYFT